MKMKSVLFNVSKHPIGTVFASFGKFILLLVVIGVTLRLSEMLLWSTFMDRQLSWETFFSFVLYSNWLTAISLGFLFVPIIIGVGFVNDKLKKIILTSCFFTLIAVQLLLLLFFFKSTYLLGSEMAKYDLNTLWMITNTEVSWYDFLLFLMVSVGGALLFARLYFYKKFKFGWVFYVVIGIVAIIFMPNNYKHLTKIKDQRFFKDRLDFYHGNSKIAYFISANKTRNTIDLTGVEPYEYYRPKPVKGTLSPYFTASNTPPNVFIIVVESLSSSFSGKSNYLGSFTPFLDSLAQKSLVWNNALSCAERTYGALPNLLASAPQGGKKGMINIRLGSDKDFPMQSNLISELSENDYHTSFSYGGDPLFNHMEYYLNFLGIDELYCKDDFLQEEKLRDSLPEKLYEWGFSDSIVFEKSLARKAKVKEPFLEIILTLGIHSPFDQNEIKSHLADTCGFNKNIAKAILKCDENIALFFDKVKRTSYYDNTIFLITGDHNVGTLDLRSPLEIFHVPLMIYSPLLQKTGEFHSVVTHRDIAPSLYALLGNNYGVKISDSLSYMGEELNVDSVFQANKETSLCLFHGSSQPNLISGKHYLLGDEVYEIKDSLLTNERIENESIKRRLKQKLIEYQKQDQIGLDKGLIPIR